MMLGGISSAAPAGAGVGARCAGKVATIVGTHRSETIRGTDGDDIIFGRGGDDIICGGNGDDRLVGGKGGDRLVGGNGNDVLQGGNGADRLVGGAGRDRCTSPDADSKLGCELPAVLAIDPPPAQGPLPVPDPQVNTTKPSPAIAQKKTGTIVGINHPSGGYFWRLEPNPNTSEGIVGRGVYNGDVVAIHKEATGSDGRLWYQASVTAGRGVGSGWIPAAIVTDLSVSPEQPAETDGATNSEKACDLSSDFAPAAGSLAVSTIDPVLGWSDQYGDWAVVTTTVSFRFSEEEIAVLRCTGDTTFEMDTIVNGLNGRKPPLLSESRERYDSHESYATNMPDGYLDTELFDNTETQRNFSVGTTAAKRLEANVVYFATVTRASAGFPVTAYVVAQRGHWAGEETVYGDKEKPAAVERSFCKLKGSTPQVCVFSSRSSTVFGPGVFRPVQDSSFRKVQHAWGELIGPYPLASQ